jgi:hypothetical protein
MCIPNRLSSNALNVTLCESSVKVICGKSPCIVKMGNLANPKFCPACMMMKSNWQSKVVNVGFLARNNNAALVLRYLASDQFPLSRSMANE